MHSEYVIVDCDAGIDDALALMMLIATHKLQKIKIAAITCVKGNTNVENVTENVFRTLHACEATDIPVYKGAYSPLLVAHIAVNLQYHGEDGFGDVYANKPDTSKLQEEHAVYALNKIVSANPGKVSIVCLGPLTNIALAIMMYPNFIKNVNELFIMGGNSTAQGNTTAQAEFNFYMDPESAHIVLNSKVNSIWLLPWETCLKCQIPMEWRKDVLAGIVLNQSIVKDSVPYHADVELHA
ncbi:hypothetical protein KM043_017784 [Ampulex compressa]|nr:hypothetical protein KM043_017784 [Ampulex compressa]